MNVTTVPKLWRHIKTGNIYVSYGTVIDCTNSTEGREMVLYAMPGSAQWYAREKVEFEKKFTDVSQKDIQTAFSRALAASLQGRQDPHITFQDQSEQGDSRD
jgi:hypothetical protein